MAGFMFRLETVDGEPAEPPTFATAVPNWSLGDVIPLGHRALRVIGKRDDEADQPPAIRSCATRSCAEALTSMMRPAAGAP
jgi:hypothetical protein